MRSNPDSLYVTLFSNSSMKAYSNNMIATFAVKLAHETDLGTDRWEMAIYEFSCPTPSVDNIKPHVVVGDTNALIYCDFITAQFVSLLKVWILRTFITKQFSVIRSLKTCVTYRSISKNSKALLYKYSTLLGILSPSRIGRHPRRSFYISDTFFVSYIYKNTSSRSSCSFANGDGRFLLRHSFQ